LDYRDEQGDLDLPLPRLSGEHQAMNGALAVAMLRHQDQLVVPANALDAAMESVDWPARLQRLAPGPLTGEREVWLDGGHNPSAAQEIANFARQQWTDGKPLHLIFASLTTKEPAGMLEPFSGVAAAVHAVPIPGHSCFAPDQLVEIAGKLGFPANGREGVEQALSAVPADARVLIFGSLYLAGSVLAANEQLPD